MLALLEPFPGAGRWSLWKHPLHLAACHLAIAGRPGAYEKLRRTINAFRLPGQVRRRLFNPLLRMIRKNRKDLEKGRGGLPKSHLRCMNLNYSHLGGGDGGRADAIRGYCCSLTLKACLVTRAEAVTPFRAEALERPAIPN